MEKHSRCEASSAATASATVEEIVVDVEVEKEEEEKSISRLAGLLERVVKKLDESSNENARLMQRIDALEQHATHSRAAFASLEERLVASRQKATELDVKIDALVSHCVKSTLYISGVKGNNAVWVNGLYEVTQEVSGGMPVYKKHGGEQWLEYHVLTGKWMSRATASRGQASGSCDAYVACSIGVLPDKALKGTWYVRANGTYAAQASVVVSRVSAAEAAEAALPAAAVEAFCAPARAAATYAVRISGATGDKADRVNGLFEVTDKISGGMPVYKKHGANNWLLEYHISNLLWILRSTTINGQAESACTAKVACAIGLLPDKAPRGAWQVLVNGAHAAQASVVVTIARNEEVAAAVAALKAAGDAAHEAATYAVRISGATGVNAWRVNGVYKVTNEDSGDMPVYKKREADQWLEYHVSTNKWFSRSSANKGQASERCDAFVDCTSNNCVLPDKAPSGAWHVPLSSKGAWAAQASVVVSPMSEEEVKAEADAEPTACAAARAAATYAVRIRGATGNKADRVNGLYEVTDQISGGMPVYKRQDAEGWLEYHVSNGMWISRSTEHKGQASGDGHAYFCCALGVLPDRASVLWYVKVNDSFTYQRAVAIFKN